MWLYPRVLAHRGAGKLAPENTLAAMQLGWQYGFRAVEFDTMLSRDGVPVLMHDPEFGRTVSARGSVAESTAAELQAMDAGAWFGPQFVGEPVPLLRDVLQFCCTHGIWMNIEIKPAPGHEEITGRVVAEVVADFFAQPAFANWSAAQLPLLSSFALPALHAAKQAAPQLARAALFEVVPHNWRAQLQALQAQALHTNHRVLTASQVAAIHAAGYAVFCYTVNEVARARELLEWGVDGFCTDCIDQIGPDFAQQWQQST